MGKMVKRFTALALAMVLLFSGSSVALGAGNNGAGQATAQASVSSPLRVEITASKDKALYWGNVVFTVTVTNTSNQTVNNISAEALFNENLRPIKPKESQITCEKTSLAPGQSFSFKYTTCANASKGLDFLIFPVLFCKILFSSLSNLDRDNGFNDGRSYIANSKAIKYTGIFTSYEAISTVRVWYEDTTGPIDFGPDGSYEINEDNIAYDENEYIYYSNNIVIIDFNWSCTEQRKMEIVKSINGEVVGQIKGLNELHVKVTPRELAALEQLVDELTALPEINLAHYDELGFKETRLVVTPNDPWTIYGTNHTDWSESDICELDANWGLRAIQAPSAWGYNEYFSSIRIGVIDTGFQPDHEDLHLIFSDSSNTAYNVPRDHGTHVAGIIGAIPDNHKGITGIVWDSELYCYAAAKSKKPDEREFSEAKIYEGLARLVENRVKVINLSMGYSEALPDSNSEFSNNIINRSAKKASEKIAQLREKGYDFIVVQSAGNGAKKPNQSNPDDCLGVDTANNQLFCSVTEENCYSSNKVGKADILNSIIIVTSSGYDGTNYMMAETANGGSRVDIAAPGSAILSTVTNNRYDIKSGTSMAAPMVTGVAGLVWSVNPLFSSAKVKNIVCTNTDEWVADNPASPNAIPKDKNGIIKLNGYRMVNARLAVEEALRQSSIEVDEGIVAGEVKDAGNGNVPLSGVRITAYRRGSTVAVDSMLTNAAGSYHLPLLVGDYDLEYSKSGYTTFRQQITIIKDLLVNADTVYLLSNSTDVPFAGGTGTELDPYLVSTPAQLNAVRNDLAAHYEQISDIDMLYITNWIPIGEYNFFPGLINFGLPPFTGSYNGNGYKISNLKSTVQGDKYTYAGLFGYTMGCTITNVRLINANINASSFVSDARLYTGGIIGFALNSTISMCCFTGNIQTSSYMGSIGGIAGQSESSILNTCFNSGEITSNATILEVGGILGYTSTTYTSTATNIINCYNNGSIGGISDFSLNVGGIIGNTKGSITNCYNIGVIAATDCNYFNYGEIAGSNSLGGIVSDCFSKNTAGSSGSGLNGTGLSEIQMEQQVSYVNFDFIKTWAINPAVNNGYPYLKGMQP